MKFASLGSGSKGNATLVSDGADCLLIDCGFSIRETEKRFSRLDTDVRQLAGVLVTHEHSDHLKGVLPLARKYRLKVYMTAGTLAKCRCESRDDIAIIKDEGVFRVGNFSITPVAVPHDAKEPVQYLIECAGRRLGILTDLGSITPHVVEYYAHCDGLVLEANHDLEMLRKGSYPESVKRRVAGDWGHLNNTQSQSLLEAIELGALQHLVLGHISEQNNSLGLLQGLMSNIEARVSNTYYACQQQGFDWLELQ